ncbi:MAG: hypothetical protein WCH34_07925 [Bacteroidota bacterium]
MRANEYIEINKGSIKFLSEIKKVIADLLPLRKDKIATDAYYEKFLMNDWRYERHKNDIQYYQLNGDVTDKPTYQEIDGAINHHNAKDFRNQLFEVVQSDQSFGYLFFQLGVEKNRTSSFHKNHPVQCVPDTIKIMKAISKYRDDYPKDNLDDFLNDSFNYDQYNILTENSVFQPNETSKILGFFNNAFCIYDNIRCLKNKPTQANSFCEQYGFEDDLQKFWILSFVIQTINCFESEDEQLVRCKKEIEKIAKALEKTLYPKGTPSFCNSDTSTTLSTIQNSKIHLSTSKGTKIDYIRVINCLFELGFFKDENQNAVTKKDVFEVFGKMINKNLNDYDKDLSRSLSDSTALEKHLEIFRIMSDKMTEIFNSK